MNETSTYLDFPGADALQATGRVIPPSEQAMDRARAAVRAATEAEAATGAGHGLVVTPVRPRRLMSGRRIVTVFALAAAAAGVVITTNSGTPATTQRPSASAQQPGSGRATAFLDGLAEVAASESAPTAPYWKVQIRSVAGAHSDTVTEYISRKGYVFLSRGKIYHKYAPTWSVGTKLVDWNGLDRLPTDPATLLSMMSAAQPSGRDVFGQAGIILANSPASPALRAGLFKALGKLNGVKVIGTTKDGIGRNGTELAFSGSQYSEALIVDPKTATVLETVFWQAGGVSRVVYLSAGPALSIG
jgi:hypothetical protein